jgi:hypothetical protein
MARQRRSAGRAVVTTLIGESGPGVQFARSAAASLSAESVFANEGPHGLALHVSVAASLLPSGGGGAQDADRDVGCLFVGAKSAVYAFDLQTGQRKHFVIGGPAGGLAVTQDGARLFVLRMSGRFVYSIDTRVGVVVQIFGADRLTLQLSD